jgi:hypothetical protein
MCAWSVVAAGVAIVGGGPLVGLVHELGAGPTHRASLARQVVRTGQAGQAGQAGHAGQVGRAERRAGGAQRWLVAIQTEIQLPNTLLFTLNCVIGIIN